MINQSYPRAKAWLTFENAHESKRNLFQVDAWEAI